MSLFRAIILLVGAATLSACASVERGVTPIMEPAPIAAIVPVAIIAPAMTATPVEPASFTVHFESAQDEIRASAMQILHGAAQKAKRGKPALVRIRGFTDASGKRDFNLKLAQRRAEAVAGQFRKLGIAARIEIEAAEIVLPQAGKAKKDPTNRKVEITFEYFTVTAETQAPSAGTVQPPAGTVAVQKGSAVMSVTIPKNQMSSVAAWLALEGYTLLTAPSSLIAAALASRPSDETGPGAGGQSRGRLGLDSTNHAP